MKMPTFVSFATPSYKAEMTALERTVDHFGLPKYLQDLPSEGTWQKNTQMKPLFIKETLHRMGEPIVWVDADARVLQKPMLFGLPHLKNYDIAVHFRTDALGKSRGGEEGELLSGTIWVNQSSGALDLLDRWIEYTRLYPDILEQQCLQRAIHSLTHVKVHKLPPEYCLIVAGGPANMGKVAQAVIAHTQASRRLKRRVKKVDA